jgi:hypothetical protein
MDLIKTQWFRSVFGGCRSVGPGMRALDWSATGLCLLLSTSLAVRRRKESPPTQIEPNQEMGR